MKKTGQGEVVEALPNDYVKVRMARSTACAECGACAHVAKDMTVIAFNPDGAQVSDWVNLSLESKYFLSAAFILYGLPLTAMILGMIAGYYGAKLLGLSNISPVLGLTTGVVFTMATHLLIKAFDEKMDKALYVPTAHYIESMRSDFYE